MKMIPSPRLDFLRGVFLANHLASTNNLTRTIKRENIYQRKLIIHKQGALINNNTIKNMLRYDRQIKPGLVALYDIRPGNGAGLFLQPRSLHGAVISSSLLAMDCSQICHFQLNQFKGCGAPQGQKIAILN